ncbi:MAG TPA: hypothetical protein VHV83_16805, partial [Armatimonadota bacterium]|nr:hypothetical protein [Armatimonadota bacterium]
MKTVDMDFTLTTQRGMAMESAGPLTITANKDWLPYDAKFDVVPGSALDFTDVAPWHTPAGKYGRVIANKDGRLTFEKQPSTPVRFCGVNLCFGAQYLTHEQADMLATRIQRMGYTTVRFHHYENYLVDQSKGDSTRLLKPQALDQLDYLFAAFKKRGIYITTDLFVTRNVLASEIWDGATGLADCNEFRMVTPINERAYTNFLAFASNLLNHVNPYTKMRWADDPALAWISFINEGCIGNFISEPMSQYCKADLTRAWNAWLAARYPSREALTGALGGKLDATQDPTVGTVPLPTVLDNSPTGLLLSRFCADTDTRFFAKTRDYLRNTIGCKALFTNLNGWTNPVQVEATRRAFDYVDDHFYIDHPQFLEKAWQVPSRSANTNPVTDGVFGGRNSAFVRLLDKPFTVSEFNYCAPGRYRGASGLLTGSMAALQDWSVLWRFAYSHGNESYFAMKPAGYFDMASDPMKQAADRATVCLFRRGDLRPATHSISIVMTPEEAQNILQTTHSISPEWNWLALVTRVGTEIIPNAASPVRADLAIPATGKIPVNVKAGKWLNIDPYNAETAGTRLVEELRKRGWMNSNAQIYQSDTKEFTVDPSTGTACIDTPKTVGGYALAGRQIKTKSATIAIDGSDASVWISSLDNVPITSSRRLLISHLT